VLGIYAESDLPLARTGQRGEYLAEATAKSLEILTNNVKNNKQKGFVLMVEGSKIDGEGHSRNPQGILAETRDFGNAVKVKRERMVVVGDTMTDVNFAKNAGVAVIGVAKNDRNRSILAPYADVVIPAISNLPDVLK
jgi:alkaline phosphatase